ncbi:PEGA domain-containing protein [bacterium]|nr:MAG: PEGA domain-containing protein [bacterium]
MKRLIAVFLVTLFLSGCATILKNKYAEVKIDSEPQGADVFIGKGRRAMRMGRTPVALQLYNKKPAYLTFKKEGYEDTTYIIRNRISHGWMLFSFLCAIGPAFIDGVSRNAYSLRETEVKVKLDPIAPQ